MKLLVLGGTGFLGSELARQAVTRGDSVTCLARGHSGAPVPGVDFVRVDRTQASAYDRVQTQRWDAVIELSWQPSLVRDALQALSRNANHWLYVSSVSAYADHSVADADESTPLLASSQSDTVDIAEYGSAKVACEHLTAERRGDSMLIARAGLIGGPGDISDRSGYWVARAARDPQAPLLIPIADGSASQVIDVRDLSAWLLDSAEAKRQGVFDVVGPPVAFHDWVAWSRQVGGHVGPVVQATASWLAGHEVGQFMGVDSMAMWVDESDGMQGWSRRSSDRARAAGLRHRDRIAMLHDILEWERECGLFRDRRAGLSAATEAALIAELELGE